MSLDTLETAAADLRNAAMVVDHLGQTTGQMVDPESAAVCAYGAVVMATVGELRKTHTGTWYGRHAYEYRSAEGDRLRNAIDALADSLLTGLCPQCELTADEGIDKPGYVVTHFNDHHCPGGDSLATILRIAALRAEGIASDARKLLTGPLLVTDNPRVLVSA